MPEEKEQQTIENENNKTGDELLALKKELADEIVDKLLEKNPNLFSILFKKSVSDYLVNENTFEDILHDEFLIGTIGKEAGLITPALEDYRNRLKEVQTKEKLDNLKTEIFKEIGQENTESRVIQENRESRIVQEENKPTTKNRRNKPSNPQPTDKKNRGSEQPLTNEKAKVDTSSDSYEIDHFNIRVSPETKKIWDNLKGKKKPDLEPFACAMKAYKTEKSKGNIKNDKYITVIDFTKNQKKSKRCFVINIQTNTVEHAEKCGHGSGSGNAEWATSFGNVSGSHKSSLGAYITADHSRSNTKGTWHSNFGKGIEKSNNKSKDRGIALLHPVKSLTYASGKPTSDGCITIPGSQKKVDKILNKIEGGSLVFAYAKSENYFAQSQFFQKNPDGSYTA